MASVLPSEAEASRLLVGPESITWRRTSDVRLYFVTLYPLLLQVAHPTVAAGVSDFSEFERRPWERLVSTLDYVTLLVYGGPDAIGAGRRLRERHRAFRGVRADGARYSALEPEAYAWVHATLIESYVVGHARFGAPLSPGEHERFYREYRGLGRLIGVRERDLPPDWSGFRAYFERTVGEVLVHTGAVDRVLRAIAQAPPPVPMPALLWRALRLPAARALWLGGIGVMPARLRARLGIRFSAADALALRSLGAFSRALTPVLPEALAVTGPAQLRARRRAIARGPLGAGAPALGARSPQAA
jgi:uncharacterized protein (DUF2236 family)